MTITSPAPHAHAPSPGAPADRSTRAATLSEMALATTAGRSGPALRSARALGWGDLSYDELGAAVREIARGLIAIGIEPGDRVSILSSTRAEWTLADLGSLCAAAVVAPVYDTNSPEECQYVLEHAGSRLVFCENAEHAAKVEKVRHPCPDLEHVVTFEGSAPGAISLAELRGRAAKVPATAPDERARDVAPADPATIVYTSGTTGPPKGCVTTHDNYMRTARMYETELGFSASSDDIVVFMFLPLAHSLARVTQMVALDVGATIACWRGDPKRLLEDLAATRPTHVPSVPRVFEKVHARAMSGLEESGRIRRALFRWALDTGRKVRELERRGEAPSGSLRRTHALADRLVLSKVRGLFGPDVRLAMTGAAAGCTRATSATSTRTATCASPAARRISSSRRAAGTSAPRTSRRRCARSAGSPRPWSTATTAPTWWPCSPSTRTRSRRSPSAWAWRRTLPGMAHDERVHAELALEVERVNSRFARIEQVKRFAIAERDLTQEAGELTPTVKVKRAVVYREYADVFDSLYD